MGEGYWDLWCHRFASNALATLTLVPPIVTLGSSGVTRFRTVRRARYLEAGLLALAAVFAIDLMFARHQDAQSSIPELTYTVLPLMFWAAVRFGPTGVSMLQLVSTGAILWAALHSLVRLRRAAAADVSADAERALALARGRGSREPQVPVAAQRRPDIDA